MNSWKPKVQSDSIIAEIRGIRRELSEQFGNNLALILADIRTREALDRHVYVSLPPRLIPKSSHEQNSDREPSSK